MIPENLTKISNKINSVTQDYPGELLIPVFTAHLIECAMVVGLPPSELRRYFNQTIDKIVETKE